MTPDELEAIRERYDDYCERSINEDEVYDAAMRCADDVPALLADLAEPQPREELMRPVVEAARAVVRVAFGDVIPALKELEAAVDTYETQTGGTE